MSNLVKIIIAVVAALIVGFVAGYILGHLGKQALENELKKADRRGQETALALKQEKDQCLRQNDSCQAAKQVIAAREALLKAVIEITANNFGLTSQHLAKARTHLKAAEKNLLPAAQQKVKAIYSKIEDAQSQALRLDAMASNSIEIILRELVRLPGAQ